MLAGDAVRISRSVELLVVTPHDFGDPSQVLGPRDVDQEVVGVDDVRLDLPPFAGVERSALDLQEMELVRGDVRLLVPFRVDEGRLRDFLEDLGSVLVEDARDVGVLDRSPVLLDRGEVRLEFGFDSLEFGRGAVRAFLCGCRRPGGGGVEPERDANQGESAVDLCAQHRGQLLLLDQRLFANADLPEVVEQARVAQLLHLRVGKERVGEGTLGQIVDQDRHVACQFGYPDGVTRRRGVSTVDRGHGRLDEAREEVLDVLVESSVFDRDRGLPRERGDDVHLAIGVRKHPAIRVLVRSDVGGRVGLPIDQLKDADDPLPVIDHGYGEHRLGPVPVLLVVHRPIERIRHVVRQLVHVLDYERPAARGGITGDRVLVEGEPERRGGNLRQGVVLCRDEVQER